MFDEPLSVEQLDSQYHPTDKNHAVNWLQTPPAQMPWGMPLANQPTIMRFTGDTCSPAPNPMGYINPLFDMKRSGPTKRKLYDDEVEMLANKQLITEEKMAANLDSLHISSDYTTHQCGAVSPTGMPGTSVQQTAEENRMPTLVLCEELRRLTSEAVLPPTVMTRVERPTNALVLWQPPAGNLGARLQQIVDACKGSSVSNQNCTKSTPWKSTDNNNSSSTEDLNEQKSKKNEQSSGSLPEDSLMEI